MALRHRRITSYAKFHQFSGVKLSPFFDDSGAHVVRSLNWVGGTRGRKVHSMRRLDRFARKLGYLNWRAYIAALSQSKRLLSALQQVAANVKTHTAEAKLAAIAA